ncbi:MAG: hypothetical protein ACKO3W_05450 [bacterium]
MLDQHNNANTRHDGSHPHAPSTNAINGALSAPFGFATITVETVPTPIATSAPLSVAAPRATSTAPSGPAKLSELVARAETMIAHLEARLAEEKLASERAARNTTDLDERLRLGVRMLQAFDVQVERGESAAQRAQDSIRVADESFRTSAQHAEQSIQSLAERLAREKFEWLERELSWRFERVKEVEERIEQAANGKLAWLDAELESRLGRIGGAMDRAGEMLARSELAIARIEGADAIVERAERATAALAGLTSESQRHIETLVARTSDAGALREALGTLVHEVSAARESVQGEMRRMRDDLGWLVEKSERLTGELVERADHATRAADELRAANDISAGFAAELSVWKDLASGTDRDAVRPIADAIASSVRDELAADMRGFSNALRQLASRADGAFAAIRVDPALVSQNSPVSQHHAKDAGSARELARTFASEISRLGGGAPVDPHANQPSANGHAIAVNQPIEIDAGSIESQPSEGSVSV